MNLLPDHDRRKTLGALLAAAVLALGFWAYLVVKMSESDLVSVGERVSDFAQIIDLESAERIDRVSRGVEERTGIDLLVVTVPTAKPYATDEYATRLLRKWAAGNPDSKGAILILVSKAEGRINIEVSPQIDFVLPKPIGLKILADHVIPMFNSADNVARDGGKPGTSARDLIGKGLREGVNAISARIADISKLEIFKQQMETASGKKQVATEEELRRRRVYLFSAIAATLLLILWLLYRAFVVRCPKCRFRVRPHTTVIELPTKGKPGLMVRSFSCKRCGFSESERLVTWWRRYLLGTLFDAVAGALRAFLRHRRRERRKRSHDPNAK